MSIVMCSLVFGSIAPAAAQYGGQSGLFVTISPSDPTRADFFGLGCAGGTEVVLYMPDVRPTGSDPAASSTKVNGRLLAVTTSVSSDDPALNGTFRFDDVQIPLDIEPGTYAVHARCGSLDLSVLLEIGPGGIVRDVTPQPPAAIAFTGRDSHGLVNYAILLLTAGMLLVTIGRRGPRSSERFDPGGETSRQ